MKNLETVKKLIKRFHISQYDINEEKINRFLDNLMSDLVNSYGDIDLLHSNYSRNFSLTYKKDKNIFEFKTTWSGIEIDEDFLEELDAIKILKSQLEIVINM